MKNQVASYLVFDIFQFLCGRTRLLNTVPLAFGELDTTRVGGSHEKTHFDGGRQDSVQADFCGILEGQHLRTCRW